jgi:hypothetical protein
MNSIEDELNIKNMYNYQLEHLDNEEYKLYLKYLNIYFIKDHIKEKYEKNYLDNKYILIDKKKSSDKIIITPSKFINIHSLYIDLKKYSDELLIKISNIVESKNNINEENRKEFEYLKNKYISYQEKIKDIESINIDYYKEYEILINKKIEKSIDLIKYYKKRNHVYSEIKDMIKQNLKNKLIKIFKDNNKKIPNISEINKIAKENLVSSNEIEKWFNWIESTYLYILVKNEIIELNKEIDNKEKNFDINTHYMIIKKPIIEEKK